MKVTVNYTNIYGNEEEYVLEAPKVMYLIDENKILSVYKGHKQIASFKRWDDVRITDE